MQIDDGDNVTHQPKRGTGDEMAKDLLERMRHNPQSDWTIKDVEKVCGEYGVKCEAPRGAGSHYKVFHPRIDHIQTVHFKRPVKAVYIRRVVRFIDAVRKLK